MLLKAYQRQESQLSARKREEEWEIWQRDMTLGQWPAEERKVVFQVITAGHETWEQNKKEETKNETK